MPAVVFVPALLALLSVARIGGSEAPSASGAFLAPRGEATSDLPDAANHSRDMKAAMRAFECFERDFGKNYTAEERELRFAAFHANFLFIEAENSKRHSYTLRLNPHSDVGVDNLIGGRPGSGAEVHGSPSAVSSMQSVSTLPSSIDWRTKGAITPVLDQEERLGGGSKSDCGSCWAFATTGAISAAWQIATGNLISLSEQQFVDCTEGSCQDGGIAGEAMKYASSHALCTRQSYPYEAMDSATCRSSQCTQALPAGSVQQVTYMLFLDESAASSEHTLMERLTVQPVAVSLYASTAFQHYGGGGVFDGPCDGEVDRRTNHVVLFVGYGTMDGADYFLLKNSWGLTWGDFGYMKIARGAGSRGHGTCNLFTRAAYPVVSATPNAPTTTSGPTTPPQCCAGCPNSAFCSPVSKNCYDTKNKDYYQECPKASSCCAGCPNSAFCSPVSRNCYDTKNRDYYQVCPKAGSCCAGCPDSAYCSPVSRNCYDTKNRDYYQVCPKASSCCAGCPNSAFCSPVSKNCYDTKNKDYYQACVDP